MATVHLAGGCFLGFKVAALTLLLTRRFCDNREQLREHSTVIYLTATPESLMRRLRFDVKRPLLQTNDPLGRLQELYAQRDPLYRETAHFHIATGRPPVSVLVTMILTQLELAGVIDPYTVPSIVDPTAPMPFQ